MKKGQRNTDVKSGNAISMEPLTKERLIWLKLAEPNEHGAGGLPSFPPRKQTYVLWKDKLPTNMAPSHQTLSCLLTLQR